MFCIGELVVYGRVGICEVLDIKEIEMDGNEEKRLCYILIPCQKNKERIITPVDGNKVQIRKIVAKEYAMDIITRIPYIEELSITDERQRENYYKEIIRSLKCEDYVRIIKTIYMRKKERASLKKRTSAIDEKYLKLAEKALYSELSLVLNLSEGEIKSFFN